MAKLTRVRIKLILLQLTSLTVASIIIIIYYNPWIGRIIDEAERSGNTGRSLADQIRRTDNEELVIFLMSTTTILVSLLGIIGALRNYEHNHCLLNFYMSTLIIFLFVVFVALCGTVWEVFGKLHRSSTSPSLHSTSVHTFSTSTSFQDNSGPYLTEFDLSMKSSNVSTNHSSGKYSEDLDSLLRPDSLPPTTTTSLHAQSSSAHHQVSWWYIGKSLLLITFSAILYATSLKLTRKILESSDDRYLSANECGGYVVDDNDDLNSMTSYQGVGHTAIGSIYPYTSTINSSRYPYSGHFNNYSGNIADIANSPNTAIGSSKSSLGSQFRTIL